MNGPETDPAHAEVAELLAAYADGELAAPDAARVEAHLLGCERCRRELAVQTAVRNGLAAEPRRPASPVLRKRVASLTAPGAPRGTDPSLWRRAAPWAGWAVAAGLAAVLLLSGEPRGAPRPDSGVAVERTDTARVPMVVDALSDYRRLVRGDLPLDGADLARVEARIPFPVVPLRSPDARLIGAWTTEILGAPAAVLAYRWGDRAVVQYVVSESLFFAPPQVRQAVDARGRYTVSAGAQGVVAWPGPGNGSILIGDMPPARLARLRS